MGKNVISAFSGYLSTKVAVASVTASSRDRGLGTPENGYPIKYRTSLADPGGAELQ
jgi:hypothetical protein